ncbi:MAG: hypothetical protein H6686_01545 [Fibrobacteria bacterium]|nr:hypothetical protein [Fibrobacteria bacterium]
MRRVRLHPSRAAWILVLGGLAQATPASSIARAWKLTPADPARPGLFRAPATPTDEGAEILVRLDTARDGSLQSCEWSAEKDLRQTDLPETRFWSILDGLAGSGTWTEIDPDALPGKLFTPPRTSLAQGFRCDQCPAPLVAATWSPHGGTRLLVARAVPKSLPTRIGVDPNVTEDGILSMARQQKLSVEARNPCKNGKGLCSFELAGSRGERWSFTRPTANAPWSLASAGYPGEAWWNPAWDWDSLRIESPREFRHLLKTWLDAELDVVGSRLIRPIEPILTATTGDWTSRRLSGLELDRTLDTLVALPNPPSVLQLTPGPAHRVRIDALGRRTLDGWSSP